MRRFVVTLTLMRIDVFFEIARLSERRVAYRTYVIKFFLVDSREVDFETANVDVRFVT